MRFYGLIAEDVEKVDPALVDHDNDAYRSASLQPAGSPFAGHLQAQQKKIEALERRLAALEAN